MTAKNLLLPSIFSSEKKNHNVNPPQIYEINKKKNSFYIEIV